ncbi:pilus assembly protein PilE [Duganella sp. Leaf126]|uniref:type IV pilin protein n=1 Tax=Duganella sp. Leaf126 TaxID=1736266 RepID=UPI0006FCF955|nr:type IV pilin protein [Duganella sp. Leaf126]KQQ42506.1 pilus assembly protein PilE [Duganella sp. Leaf126]
MNTPRGFSLIELLVVSIIAMVLAAVAAPLWTEHVVRTRRYEAQATMQRLMLQQERYFTQHGSYLAFGADVDADDPDVRSFQWWSGATAPASGYEIAGKACDGHTLDSCVQLLATPGTQRVDARFRDTDCGQLRWTSSGLRQADGPQTTCWR